MATESPPAVRRGHSAPDASEAGQAMAGSATEDEDVAEQRRAVQQNSIPGMALDSQPKSPVLHMDKAGLSLAF